MTNFLKEECRRLTSRHSMSKRYSKRAKIITGTKILKTRDSIGGREPMIRQLGLLD